MKETRQMQRRKRKRHEFKDRKMIRVVLEDWGGGTHLVQITSGIKHGEFDQNRGRKVQRLTQLRVQDLALVHGPKRQQSLLSLLDGDVITIPLLDSEGAVGLDHLGAAGTSVNHRTLSLVQSLQSLLVGGELDKGKRHVVGVATDLDPALPVLKELAVDGSLKGNIVLRLRQAEGR